MKKRSGDRVPGLQQLVRNFDRRATRKVGNYLGYTHPQLTLDERHYKITGSVDGVLLDTSGNETTLFSGIPLSCKRF
ncbi:MAG TPA: hypothetical protein VI837_10010 [Blastocatellia bacterium]|nr:hypothetical protein [Blastocatellia bacterium]